MSDFPETLDLFDDLLTQENLQKAEGQSSAPLIGDVAKYRSGQELKLEPLDATFRDSSKAPLHSWFPYLEGYSPRFVERVLHEYLPDAHRIIEPFAGSGTTPIVLGQSGIECAYSEANPAMAFITETKLAALKLTQRERMHLIIGLRSLAKEVPQLVATTYPDEGLRLAYARSFGDSIFFDEPYLEEILRLRTVNDELSEKDTLLSRCFAVAVLSSLIPSSRLKRAGDLRYKTPKELSIGLPRPTDLVSCRLLAQAIDMESAAPVTGNTYFACATANELHKKLNKEWDGVITSPPYLNGTNYIRNARLELWYLRQVKENSDLRDLRNRVITSGINDVHAKTNWDPATPGIEKVVRTIELNTYDSRIAKMVGGYFNDMATVFSSLKECLRGSGKLCIDIGDSIYNGIHVPTDNLLVELAESMGYKTLERVHLRNRLSKSGAAVHQQLLIFEHPKRMHVLGGAESTSTEAVSGTQPEANWRSEWEFFKENLPHQQMPYSKREWGGPMHSMCSYQGKMKPALAHHLIQCFSTPGDIVLDPFSGAGTIPLEACRLGRRGYGIDISRLGHVLTLAKVAKSSSARIEELLCELEAFIEKYQPNPKEIERCAEVRFNSAIPDYFHPETLREVLAARAFFLSRWNTSAEWAILFSCTLHLLHGNRPYALSRRSHPVTPFKPTGDFEYRALLPRLRKKVTRIQDELRDDNRLWGGSAQGDCTAMWPASIPKADVIITSPPFYDSTRFYMANWMRFWFVGWEREDFDTLSADFLETKQKQNLDIYRLFYKAARERLRDGGLMVLHLGNSAKCDMGAELSKRTAPWFSVEDLFTEGVEHCESHGFRDKGTVHGHTYLILSAN